jgi:hypothetical protein
MHYLQKAGQICVNIQELYKEAYKTALTSIGATWSSGLVGEGWGGVYGHPESSWVEYHTHYYKLLSY